VTIMQSCDHHVHCDHHDVGGCVPDNRSRRRILEQFKAAHDLGMAVQSLTHFGMRIDLFDVGKQPLERPTITVDLGQFLHLWMALRVWRDQQPKGDDLAPPVDPPAEIRVPEYDEASPEDAAPPGEGLAPR
jgi:hypothetical protein